jgi:hypothetical protein
MAKVGRPKKKLDYKLIESLAEIHCTQEEIAGVLEVSVRTLQRDAEFCRIYNKGREQGKISLRRLQWKRAEEGSDKMLIWLGIQTLGQVARQEVTGKDGAPLVSGIQVTMVEPKRVDS